MAGQTDGMPFFTDGDEPDLSAYTQDLTNALRDKFVIVADVATSNRAQADLALSVARSAWEAPTAVARVVDGGIVIASSTNLGSIALDVSAITKPTTTRLANSPTRLQAPVAGVYEVDGLAAFAGLPSDPGPIGRRYLQVRRNAAGNPNGGQDVSETWDMPAGLPGLNAPHIARVHAVIEMAQGEYLEMFVAQTQGSGLRVLGGRGGTRLSLKYIRPL